MPSSIQDAKASSPPAVGAVCKLTTFPFPGRRLTPRANRDSQLALARAVGRITPGFNPGPPSCPPLEAYTRSPTPSADASPASVDDWPSLAIKLKSRSVPILHIYEKVKFVESCQKIDRNLRSISKEDIEKQFKIFLQILHNITQYKTYNDLEKSDPKEMIRYFMQHEHLYSGVELVMNATAVAAIKLSVESIAESYISIYNIHNSDIRAIKEEAAEDEMMIHINGPAIGEADDTLKAALDKYFNGSQWHFSVEGNIFRSSGITVDKLLKKKSRLPFYKIKK